MLEDSVGLSVSLASPRQHLSSSSRTVREAKRASIKNVRTGPSRVCKEASRERAFVKCIRLVNVLSSTDR